MKTELKDRTLFFDGTIQVAPEQVPSLLLAGVPVSKVRVTAINEDVREYNLLVDEPLNVHEPSEVSFDKSWKIPEEFLKLDVRTIVLGLAAKLGPEYSKRAEEELSHIERKNLIPLIQTLMFIISEFKRTGVVYGIGRGSSCASLVLFLIGVHKIDPLKYSIPMSEFFHD